METVKIAVNKPICKGNFSFIKLGINTFPNEIAIPINAVPISNKDVVPKDRIIMPPVNKMMEKNKVSSIPKRRATLGAKGEITANARRGIVVIKPANTFEIVRPSRIYEIIGPTEVRGDLKEEDMKIIPSINKIVFFLFKTVFDDKKLSP
jgi:hypothetical protein